MELSPVMFWTWLIAPPFLTGIAASVSSSLRWAGILSLGTIIAALVATALFLDSSGWGLLLLLPVYASTAVTLLIFGLAALVKRSGNS